MTNMILSQMGRGTDIPYIIKLALIICGVIAVAYIIFQVIGVKPPWWLIQILIIVAAIFVGIMAINFLLSL